MKDRRIVYGARCLWWDSIDRVAAAPSGLPICPHCGSPLFELDNILIWWQGVDRHEAEGHPGYHAMIEWSQGRCFKSVEVMEAAFLEAIVG